MSLPFVQAKFYSPGGRDPRRVLAAVHHMAEGGGTVHFLSQAGSVANNNSSTLVIDYDGKVTQMVRVYDMDHSLHVGVDADTHDAPDFGIFSLAAAEAVLAPAGLGQLTNMENVLPFLVSMEWEGYAGTAPLPGHSGYDARANPAGGLNAKQQAALVDVVEPWLRESFPSLRGNLGHRDFQDYKPCPGGKFPWSLIGGHGLVEVAADVNTVITVLPFGGTFVIPAGQVAIAFAFDPATGAIGAHKTLTPVDHPKVDYDATVVTTATRGDPFLRIATGAYKGWLVSAAAVTETLNGPPAPPVVDVDAAKRAAVKAALDHVAPAYAALGTAIAEARTV